MMQRYLRALILIASFHSLASAAVKAQCPIAATCTPGRASNPQAASFGMGIFNVTLGSINNTTGGNPDGYQDYGCTQQAQLARGLTYPISIRTNPNANETVRVWIDYNNDGQFNPTTELFFASDNAQLHAGTSLIIPSTAVLGTALRLRVAADATTAPVPTPCSTPQYSQTEDYSVVLGTNTQRPIAAFSSSNANSCTGVFTFTDLSSQGPSTWRWSFGDGTFSTQQSPAHTYTAPGTYRVQLRACNANGCDSLAVNDAVSWYPVLSVAPQCTPATTAACCGYGVTKFSFAGQSMSSADGRAGYEDFSCVRRFAVQQGQAYPLQVTTGNTQPHVVRVYIDYNNNGSFAEPEELVFEVLSASNPSGTLFIAGGGITGVPLRLRVVADIVGQSATSCTAPSLGQVEDYSVVISPSLCTGLPAVLPRIEQSQACTGLAAALYFPSPSAGASLQWQSSADSLTWANVPTATAPLYQVPATNSLYYRVRVVCGTTTRYTSARRPGPVAGLCYCRPVVNGNWCGHQAKFGRIWMPTTTLDLPAGACGDISDDAGRVLGLHPTYQTAVLQPGTTYQLNATIQSTSSVQFVYAWLDTNRNGQFEASEYLPATYTVTNSNNSAARISVTVPTTAALGVTGLRLALDSFRSPTSVAGNSCQQLSDGETLDLLVTIAPANCATATLTGGVVQGPRTYCPNTVPSLSVLFQTPNANLQWQTSPDSLRWTDVAGAQSARLGGNPAQYHDSLYVRVRVQCGANSAYSAAVYLRADPQLCFCTSATHAPAFFAALGPVRLANTPLSARLSPTYYNSAYHLYPPTNPANTATLLAGISYPVLIQPKAAGASLAPYVVAWLDVDNNGRFVPSEGTLLNPTITSSVDSVFTLTLPPTTLAARQARLRTVSGLDVDNLAPNEACSSSSSDQEMRDFLVTLAPATPSALPLTAGLVQGLSAAGIVNNCPGQRIRLSVVGYSRGAQLQWQQQPGGTGPWQAVPNATREAFISDVLTSATAFRVEARLGAATAVSAAVVASPTGPCPCRTGLGGLGGNYPASIIQQVRVVGPGSLFFNRSATAPQPANGAVYTDYSLLNDSLHTTLYRGYTYQMEVLAFDSPNTPSDTRAWADFNGNGVFEAGESFGGGLSVTFPFTVPATATPGPVRVRVRSRDSYFGNFLQPGDACRNLAAQGETEDYTFTVADPPAFIAPEITMSGTLAPGGTLQLGTRYPLPAGTVRVWEGPGGFVSTQASPTLSNLTAAQSGDYYLTARTASGNFQLTAARRLQIGQGLATQPTGVAAEAVELYPNPTSGLAALHLSSGAPAYETLRVLNSTGQLLLTRALTAQDRGIDLPIDLSSQPRGLYLVQLVGPSGMVSRKLLLE